MTANALGLMMPTPYSTEFFDDQKSGFESQTGMSNVSCCNFDDFANAMADETRQHILSLLQEGEMNESELVSRLDLTQPTISHHLAVLRRANLVQTRRQGKYVFYRANPACVIECCGQILSRFNIRPIHGLRAAC